MNNSVFIKDISGLILKIYQLEVDYKILMYTEQKNNFNIDEQIDSNTNLLEVLIQDVVNHQWIINVDENMVSEIKDYIRLEVLRINEDFIDRIKNCSK